MKEEMTVSQALKEGYTLCGRGNREWECLAKIEDLQAIDFLDGDYYLADKEGAVHTFSEARISELFADVISTEEGEKSGRDDDEIYHAISAIDYSYVAKQIQDVLDGHMTFEITDIKLIA